MGRLALPASSPLAKRAWPSSHWAACHRRGRSLQRRMVQAGQAGAWRTVKRRSSVLVPSFAARTLAVTRVTEHAGKKTPGVEKALWGTPEKNAAAVQRLGQWRGYRPQPLHRLSLPKKHGTQRPLSIPTMDDRARHAFYLQALQPIAATTAEPHADGCRPPRRCADAIDQGLKVLRQHTSAAWILAGDSAGFFDQSAFSWRETHLPMHTQGFSTWLRSGVLDRGTLFPTTTGGPQGGIVAPVSSHMVLDGLEAVVHGSRWHRRTHHSNYGRWADDFMVTANARQVLEHTVLPRITALLAERGVRLSTTKTVSTPLAQGVAFLGQTLRKHGRRHGTRAKRQIPPSTASLQTITTQITPRCKPAAGATPEPLIGPLTPVLRGWANSPRHVICSKTFATLDSFVWRRLYRWVKLRHPNKTGRWLAARSFPHRPGAAWRCTDPTTGKQLIRVQEVCKHQRHLKIQGDATPFETPWEAYFQHRERQLALQASAALRAKVLQQQHGDCPICRQVLQDDASLELHHRDGNHQQNRLANLGLFHPNGHRQGHDAPERHTEPSRPAWGVGHA